MMTCINEPVVTQMQPLKKGAAYSAVETWLYSRYSINFFLLHKDDCELSELLQNQQVSIPLFHPVNVDIISSVFAPFIYL